ncbi:MAG: hypothetical protein AAF211_30280, partial [Myxococcota bacterium]
MEPESPILLLPPEIRDRETALAAKRMWRRLDAAIVERWAKGRCNGALRHLLALRYGTAAAARMDPRDGLSLRDSAAAAVSATQDAKASSSLGRTYELPWDAGAALDWHRRTIDERWPLDTPFITADVVTASCVLEALDAASLRRERRFADD